MSHDQKTGGNSSIIAAVVIIVLIVLFGAFGGLICFGGYLAVRAIIKSGMSVPARVIFSVIVILAFLALMAGYLYLSVVLQTQMDT